MGSSASHTVDVIFGGLIFVALVTTLVMHPETKNVINAAGTAFNNSLGTAIKG